MFNQLLKAFKMAPRLAWQSFFQLSKVFDYLGKSERNKYIYLNSFFSLGLAIGILLAIPDCFIYGKLIKSTILALIAAVPFVVSGLVVFKIEVEQENESPIEGALFVAVIVVIVFALVFVVAVAENFPGAFAATAAVAGAVAVGVAITAARSTAYLYSFTFIGITMVILSTMGKRINTIAIYETFVFLLTFLSGYIQVSSFEFQKNISNLKKNFKNKVLNDIDIPQLRFSKTQKASLLWAPLFALLIGVLDFTQLEQDLIYIKVIITGGFAILPIFILRIPDYMICLLLWNVQLPSMLNFANKGKAVLESYTQSILFKHEMIYFQLPDIHKLMISFARCEEIGLKEAVKQINCLYFNSFQQKQVQKAIVALGQDNNAAHRCIHFLLEENNLALIRFLSKENQLAEHYLMLFEDKYIKANQSVRKHSPFLKNLKILKSKKEEKSHPVVPGSFIQRLDLVVTGMEKENKYRFNIEMIRTLKTAYQFLTANTLKDFYKGCNGLEIVMEYSGDINYFFQLQQLYPSLVKIKENLVQIEEIDRFESKRSFLMEQKEALNTVLKMSVANFCQPFQSLWQKAFQKCIELLDKEMILLQGSAVLTIQLRNQNIFASNTEQLLYFDILNKGREMASGISIVLKSGSLGIKADSQSVKEIQLIEAGKEKEISLPIRVPSPLKTKIEGTLNFSDRTRENKSIFFSFPVIVSKRSIRFKRIDNPYVVGQPLAGDAPLFVGRDEAYQFIDENITTSGGERHIIVCHGLRRTGKTSLLYKIENKGLKDGRLVPIFIDMQGINLEKDFYNNLSIAIKEKLSLPKNSDTNSFSHFQDFLREIKPQIGPRILLLMIDEFEELQMRVESGMIENYIFSNIRHLMQHEQKLAFLFCGTHKLEEMSSDYWSIFFNTALYYRISHLSKDDARSLIIEPVRGKLTYDDLAVDQILKMTNGQPYLTQLICRTIINEMNETKKRNDALVDDVDDAVEKVISAGKDHFSNHIWENSGHIEKLILSVAAEELTNRELSRISLDDIFTRIHSITDRFERQQVVKSLDKLVSQEILCEGENGYYFPVNLLRKWIASRKPLRKVREKIV